MASQVSAHAARIAVSGSYSGPLDLDDDGSLERDADPDPQEEGFSAVLDDEGLLQHVFTIVGPDGDVANAAGFSPDGRKLYVTGYTKLGADFDADGVIEAASACHQLGDLYLASYALPD
jgi:sugar lactone lactonase YvrE